MKYSDNFIYLLLLLSPFVESGRDRCPKGDRWCRKNRQGKALSTQSHTTADGVHCPECIKITCNPKKIAKLKCKGGITTSVCNCCPACAKVLGEECGGRNNYLGKCDRGLQCVTNEFPVLYDPSSESPPTSMSGVTGKGVCMEANVQDQPPTCKPACTPEFCMANPKAICSASDNAIMSSECQGDCQHTGCSACFFQSAPKCKKCAPNDFRCIKKFAKCARKNTCSRNKFPCKKKIKNQPDGKFLCWVPECV